MCVLVDLVSEGVLSSACSRVDACVRILGDALVCLLGSLSTSALDRLRDVVGRVLGHCG